MPSLFRKWLAMVCSAMLVGSTVQSSDQPLAPSRSANPFTLQALAQPSLLFSRPTLAWKSQRVYATASWFKNKTWARYGSWAQPLIVIWGLHGLGVSLGDTLPVMSDDPQIVMAQHFLFAAGFYWGLHVFRIPKAKEWHELFRPEPLVFSLFTGWVAWADRVLSMWSGWAVALTLGLAMGQGLWDYFVLRPVQLQRIPAGGDSAKKSSPTVLAQRLSTDEKELPRLGIPTNTFGKTKLNTSRTGGDAYIAVSPFSARPLEPSKRWPAIVDGFKSLALQSPLFSVPLLDRLVKVTSTWKVVVPAELSDEDASRALLQFWTRALTSPTPFELEGRSKFIFSGYILETLPFQTLAKALDINAQGVSAGWSRINRMIDLRAETYIRRWSFAASHGVVPEKLPQLPQSILLKMPLNAFDWTTRMTNVFVNIAKEQPMATLGDVFSMTRSELLRNINYGLKSEKEIDKVFSDLGIRWQRPYTAEEFRTFSESDRRMAKLVDVSWPDSRGRMRRLSYWLERASISTFDDLFKAWPSSDWHLYRHEARLNRVLKSFGFSSSLSRRALPTAA